MDKIRNKILIAGMGLALGVGVFSNSNNLAKETLATNVVGYSLIPSTGTNNEYAKYCDVTIGGIKWNVTGNSTVTPWRMGGKGISSVDRAVYSKDKIAFDVTSITLSVGSSTITVNSLKLVYSANADFTSSTEISATFAATSDISFAPTSGTFGTNKYYKFVFNVTNTTKSNKYFEFKQADFYKVSDGGPNTYNVVFDKNGHGTAPEALTGVEEGTTISAPEAPICDGYTFGGWYKEAGCTNAWDFANDTVNAATTLYAKWTANAATISFDANGATTGTAPTEVATAYDEKITMPECGDLAKNGYVFGGWNEAADGTGKNYAVGDSYTVKGDKTLYAKWNLPGDKYQLVSSATSLAKGDKIVIASSKANGNAYAMSNTQNSNNRGQTGITIASSEFEATDAVAIITLGTSDNEAKSESNYWTLGVTGGFLTAASNSSNNLKTAATADANAYWAITIDSESNEATLTTQGTYTRNCLRYNGGNSIFSLYATGTTTGNAPFVYKLKNNSPESKANEFAQSFLDAGLCDGGTNAPSTETWGTLATAFAALSSDDKALFAADKIGSATGTTIQQCLARYDLIVSKYGKATYTDFMGRNPQAAALSNYVTKLSNNNNSTAIIIVIAVTSISLVGVLVVLKKRKVNSITK